MEGDILNIFDIIKPIENKTFVDLLVDLDNNGFRIVCHADGTYSLNPDEALAVDMRYAWFTHLGEAETIKEGGKILAHPFGPWVMCARGHLFRNSAILYPYIKEDFVKKQAKSLQTGDQIAWYGDLGSHPVGAVLLDYVDVDEKSDEVMIAFSLPKGAPLRWSTAMRVDVLWDGPLPVISVHWDMSKKETFLVKKRVDFSDNEWSFLKDVLKGHQYKSVDAFHLTVETAVNENRHRGYNVNAESITRDFTEAQILEILNAVK